MEGNPLLQTFCDPDLGVVWARCECGAEWLGMDGRIDSENAPGFRLRAHAVT